MKNFKKIFLLSLMIFISYTTVVMAYEEIGSGTISVNINPPTCTLSTTPNPVAYNGTVNIIWSSTSAGTCSFHGSTLPPAGGVAPNQTYSIGGNTTTHTESMTCTGYLTEAPAATVTCSTTVTVTGVAPTITSPTCTNITSTSMTAGANVTSLGTPTSITRGTCMGSGSPTNCSPEGGTTTGVFTHSRTGLTPNTTYYVYGYAENSSGRTYTSSIQCKTPASTVNQAPTVSAGVDKSITLPTNSVSVTGTASDSDGPAPLTYAWTNTFKPAGATVGISSPTALTTTLTGLTVVGTYTFKLTATESGSSPLSGSDTMDVVVSPAPSAPVVTLVASPTSGTVNTVNPTLTWTTTNSPTSCTASGDWSGSKTTTGGSASTGVLATVKTYTYSLVCANAGGNSNTATATVVVTATLPTVTTVSPVVTITQTSGTGGGTIVDNGGALISVSGIVWSKTAIPATNVPPTSPYTTTGWAAGTWSDTMTGLTPNTLYHYRAYATNSVGTAYGADVTFTTLPINPPTVTTVTPVTSITQVSGKGGGTIVDNGGALISVSGIVWSKTAIPATNVPPTSPYTTTGWAAGTWSDTMTGLTPNTLYHYRAYATNVAGTSYGADVSFTTTINNKPIANAGINQAIILPISSVTMAGTASDSDGPSPLTTLWSQTAGPSTATITSPTSLTTSITGLTQGVYTFSLIATDGGGAISTPSTMTVTVDIPADVAITSFKATPDTIVQGRAAVLTWSTTDAASCTGTNFSTSNLKNNLSPGVIIKPTATTVYTLTCTSVSPATAVKSSITTAKVVVPVIIEN